MRDHLTGDQFRLLPDGHVEVRSPTGQVGVFAYDGSHISGDLTYADPHYIQWVHDTPATKRSRS